MLHYPLCFSFPVVIFTYHNGRLFSMFLHVKAGKVLALFEACFPVLKIEWEALGSSVDASLKEVKM